MVLLRSDGVELQSSIGETASVIVTKLIAKSLLEFTLGELKELE